MEINKILDNLESIGLSRKEEEVFLELVKNSNSNGSQIAKSLECGHLMQNLWQ